MVNEIAFTPTRAKFVRIRQTGSADNAPWTMQAAAGPGSAGGGGDGFVAATIAAMETFAVIEHRRRSGGNGDQGMVFCLEQELIA